MESGQVPVSVSEIASDLEDLPDEKLQEVVSKAREILTARADARKRDAMAKIKALAKEHGLNVAIDRQPRKRGRPRKKE